MVTKKMLARLRAERSVPHAEWDYTIDGPIHTLVVTRLDAEREKAIARGEQSLREALDNFRREQALSSHRGLARAKFNNHEQELEP